MIDVMTTLTDPTVGDVQEAGATPPGTAPPPAEAILARLRGLPGDAGEGWRLFDRDSWRRLFPLLAVAADLPRLSGHRSLAELPAGHWPNLDAVAADVANLQRMIDHPVVPADADLAACHPLAALEQAAAELDETHCATVDFLLDQADRRRLDALVAKLATERAGSWGQLERAEAPDLFALFDQALASDRFGRLTGFDFTRDTYSLTLSLQDLDPAGIGWHRDLYWPREWVGEDVFAVLYGLGGDSPEKGGAFVYYVPWLDQLRARYRRRHEATVLWNSADDAGRILHAVSGYHTADTSRHLIILQCLRRG